MRYFIVMWRSTNTTGTATVKTPRNRYINRDSFINDIQVTNEVSDVVITNIIELSKRDFNNWNS